MLVRNAIIAQPFREYNVDGQGIPGDRRYGKKRRKRWWAAQFIANQSLLPISLIHGNLQ
jgi:hypothetical protein